MDAENRPSFIAVLLSLLSLLIWPALLLFLAGDWHWIVGWIFSGWFLGLCTRCLVWLYRHNPALLAERFRRPGSGGQKAWDQLLVYALLVGFIAWIVLMPLDAKRFAWTASWLLWLRFIGGVLLVPSWFFLFRSFTDNAYLSPLVRIQTERRHRVVSTGVYAFVRHPMYLGAILMFVGVPLFLGSLVGMLSGLGLALLLAIRIAGEERLLVDKLEGYADYRHAVRYRLIPHVW